mgnify:CR=1 FL=1
MAGDTLEIVINVDLINVDGFLDLVELQQHMTNPPTAQNLRDMYRLVAPAIVSPAANEIPARYMNQVFTRVMAGLTAGVDPN